MQEYLPGPQDRELEQGEDASSVIVQLITSLKKTLGRSKLMQKFLHYGVASMLTYYATS